MFDKEYIEFASNTLNDICSECLVVQDILKEDMLAKQKLRFEPLYNSIAEAFLDIRAYCILKLNKCWTQSGAILRIAIERISKINYMAMNKELIDKFCDRYRENKVYIKLPKKQKELFMHEKNIDRKTVNNYFDYGWAEKKYTNNYVNRNIILKECSLIDLKEEINIILNKFVHCELSIFDFNGGKKPWDDMRNYGCVMDFICFLLYGRLFYSVKFLLKNPILQLNMFWGFLSASNMISRFDSKYMQEKKKRNENI